MVERDHGRKHPGWLGVWNALVNPRPAWEIAVHTGVFISAVHRVISQFNKFRPKAIEGNDFGKRRGAYLSKDQEVELLKPCIERASTGEI